MKSLKKGLMGGLLALQILNGSQNLGKQIQSYTKQKQLEIVEILLKETHSLEEIEMLFRLNQKSDDLKNVDFAGLLKQGLPEGELQKNLQYLASTYPEIAQIKTSLENEFGLKGNIYTLQRMCALFRIANGRLEMLKLFLEPYKGTITTKNSHELVESFIFYDMYFHQLLKKYGQKYKYVSYDELTLNDYPPKEKQQLEEIKKAFDDEIKRIEGYSSGYYYENVILKTNMKENLKNEYKKFLTQYNNKTLTFFSQKIGNKIYSFNSQGLGKVYQHAYDTLLPLNPQIVSQKQSNESSPSLKKENLTPEMLKGVSGIEVDVQELVRVVNDISHIGLKTKIITALKKGDFLDAQYLMGMHPNSYYDYNKAYPKITSSVLQRFEKINLYAHRCYLSAEEVQKSQIIPFDVKYIHKQFLEKKIEGYDNGNYIIVCKSDAKAYLFSYEHALLSWQPVLLGKEKGNAQRDVNAGIFTTPPGRYLITYDPQQGPKKENYYGDPTSGYPQGYYLVLRPLDNQYPLEYNEKGEIMFTLGIHPCPTPEEREPLFDIVDEKQRLELARVSDGCINFSRRNFAEIIDHLGNGNMIYVTTE